MPSVFYNFTQFFCWSSPKPYTTLRLCRTATKWMRASPRTQHTCGRWTPAKQMENSNLIILFPQDQKNISHIYADHCSSDMDAVEFKSFCHRVWNEEGYNFVTIDLSSTKSTGKYRQNLNTVYFPTSI